MVKGRSEIELSGSGYEYKTTSWALDESGLAITHTLRYALDYSGSLVITLTYFRNTSASGDAGGLRPIDCVGLCSTY